MITLSEQVKKSFDLLNRLQEKNKILEAQNEIYKLALDEISNPIKYIQERASKEGFDVNGSVAVSLSQDPEYLRDIAKNALIKGN